MRHGPGASETNTTEEKYVEFLGARAAWGSGGRAGWRVTGMLVRSPIVEVSLRHLTPTAPDELAVALHGRLRRRCVNVCMIG